MSFQEKVDACLRQLLREEYPFTHTSTINAVSYWASNQVAFDIVNRKRLRDRCGVRPLDFLGLPTEVREMIYGYALTQPKSIYVGPCECMSIGSYATQPDVTRVSRQIRQESLPLFYALNRFETSLEPIWWNRGPISTVKVNRWLMAIGEKNAGRIKNFRVVWSEYRLAKGKKKLHEYLGEEGLSLVREEALTFRRLGDEP